MKKKRAISLAVVIALCSQINCLAANNVSVDTAGGSAKSAVKLSVEDTSIGVEGEIFSAYVPAELPIKMDLEGTVVVPSNAMIINGVETRGIKVTDINIEMLNDWTPASYEDDFNTKEEDSKEVAIKLRNDYLQQDGSFNLTDGDWDIAKDSYIPLEMDVKIPKQSEEGSKGDISNIQFTMDWSGDDESVGPAVPTGTYTLNFEDSENGTIVDKTEITTNEYGQVTSLPETLPDIGYKLLKWVEIENNFEVKIGDVIDKNIIIKPIFVEDDSMNKVTITFNCVNCSIDGSNVVEVKKGTVFNDVAKPEIVGDAGYLFDGYYTDDNIYVNRNTIINRDLTVNVVYTEVEVVDNAFYYGVSSGEVEVNGINQYDLSSSNGILRIPEEIDGMKVTSIDSEAFQYETGIVQVVIPETVKEIGDEAFYMCTNLRDIQMTDSVKTIGSLVFSKCSSLESVNIPVLGISMFRDCNNLTDVNLGDNITEIPVYTFANCGALEEININDNVETIGAGAFSYCRALKYVGLPSNLKTIDSRAFEFCTGIESITIPEGTVNVSGFYHCSNLRTVDIPSTAKYISGFSDCINLEELYIPEGAITVKDFYNCSKLTTLRLPEGVENIENLYGCASIPYITLPSTLKTIGTSTFRECDVSHMTIPNGVTSIGDSAFYCAKTAETIVLPESVKYIYGYAFAYVNAREITINDATTNISERAFQDVTHITYNGTAEGSPWGAYNIN